MLFHLLYIFVLRFTSIALIKALTTQHRSWSFDWLEKRIVVFQGKSRIQGHTERGHIPPIFIGSSSHYNMCAIEFKMHCAKWQLKCKGSCLCLWTCKHQQQNMQSISQHQGQVVVRGREAGQGISWIVLKRKLGCQLHTLSDWFP